jgi:hypothetical protein
VEVENELVWYGKRLSSKFKQLRVMVISDLHYGNPYCSIKHFIRTIDFIKINPDVFIFLNGDLLESSIKTSKGDIFKQVGTPQDQRDWVVEKLTPIKDRILGVTTGNHESRIYGEVGVDLSADIAKSLDVPYRPEGMLFKIQFGSGNDFHPDKPYAFWSYITHGYGGARTKSAKAVKVERIGGWLPKCDWLAMSHDHVVNVAPDIDFIPDERGTENDMGFLVGKITAHRKMLIKTNAYLRWGGYAEMGGFPPSDLASPVIYLLTPQSPGWLLYPEKPRRAVKVVV